MSADTQVDDILSRKPMTGMKKFFLQNFERIVILVILAVVAASHFFFVRGTLILFFYFLPALVAGYFMGRRYALKVAIFSVCVVTFVFIMSPKAFMLPDNAQSQLNAALDLAAWGGFLVLAALITGQLYEEKESRIQNLRSAYLGILDVLSRYLEDPEGPSNGHCLRVAELAAEVGTALDLPQGTIDNIRAAALLHDMRMVDSDISGDIIQRAAMLSETDDGPTDAKTVEILSSVGVALRGALSLIRCQADQGEADQPVEQFTEIPIGAYVVGIADAYDQLVVSSPGTPGRAPWVAVKELEKGVGTRFDAEAHEALKSVIAHHMEEQHSLAAVEHG